MLRRNNAPAAQSTRRADGQEGGQGESDRFGVFEALAYSTIKLNRCTSVDELSMDPRVAEAVLEFGADLRTALAASDAWAATNGIVYPWQPAETEEAA